MRKIKTNVLASGLAGSILVLTAIAQITEDPAKECTWCEIWNQPQQPYQVFGNTW